MEHALRVILGATCWSVRSESQALTDTRRCYATHLNTGITKTLVLPSSIYDVANGKAETIVVASIDDDTLDCTIWDWSSDRSRQLKFKDDLYPEYDDFDYFSHLVVHSALDRFAVCIINGSKVFAAAYAMTGESLWRVEIDMDFSNGFHSHTCLSSSRSGQSTMVYDEYQILMYNEQREQFTYCKASQSVAEDYTDRLCFIGNPTIAYVIAGSKRSAWFQHAPISPRSFDPDGTVMPHFTAEELQTRPSGGIHFDFPDNHNLITTLGMSNKIVIATSSPLSEEEDTPMQTWNFRFLDFEEPG